MVVQRDRKSPRGQQLPGLKQLRPVQGQIDIFQIDIQHHLVPGQAGGRGLLIQVQHGVYPALKGGQNVAGALPHPQQQQGFQRTVPGHNEAQIRVVPPHDPADKVLRQDQHGGDLPPLQGGDRLLFVVHGPDFAVLGDVLHVPHVALQQPGNRIPLRGGDGQGHPGKVHPPGQQSAGRPARPKGEDKTQKDKPRQQPAQLTEPVQGQYKICPSVTGAPHQDINAQSRSAGRRAANSSSMAEAQASALSWVSSVIRVSSSSLIVVMILA